MPRINRLAAATAIAAVLVTAAVPAAAADLPRPHGPASAQAYDGDANTAENRRWHRHRNRGGIDGGDILAGVLILGGIAAVAGAIENNNRNDDYRDYPPPPPRGGYDQRYNYRDGAPQSSGSGLDRAADICADAVERTSDPVASVDSVRRGPSGWDVDGTLRDGRPFACRIGNNGQIEDVRIDRAYSGAAYGAPAPAYSEPSYEPYDGTGVDNRPYYDEQSNTGGQYNDQYGAQYGDQNGAQYSDETYARLRAQQGG